MQNFLSSVKQYISDNGLLEQNSRIIVGFSGGADSVSLLHVLTIIGYECVVAHCNFHLRGEESVRDEAFARNLCREWDIPFYLKEFHTTDYAKEKGISIEMAARELRYSWFEELGLKLDIPHIAIAHHKDDSVETILINLIRGTGIKGLTGISPRNGKIIRPLLCLNRSDILSYLEKNGLKYVTDSTNAEDEYVRNKIRLNLLPLLETINPSVKESIGKTAARLRQVENIYSEYIGRAKRAVFKNDKVDIGELQKWEEPEAILFELLSPYGFNGDIVSQMIDSLEAQSGKIFYSDSYMAVKDREFIILDKLTDIQEDEYRIGEKDSFLSHPVRLKIETINMETDFVLEKKPNILYLDAGKIKYPFMLRRWKSGDWFVPFGMTGRKKLSDYFSDHKFSLIDKKNTWILCSGDDILWIVGNRSDNRFRINSNTQRIIRMELV